MQPWTYPAPNLDPLFLTSSFLNWRRGTWVQRQFSKELTEHQPGQGHFHLYLEQQGDNLQEKTVHDMHQKSFTKSGTMQPKILLDSNKPGHTWHPSGILLALYSKCTIGQHHLKVLLTSHPCKIDRNIHQS